MLVLSLFLSLPFTAFAHTTPVVKSLEVQQNVQKKINGTIKDQKGESVPFAYVVVKGAAASGTVSNEFGKFEITVNGFDKKSPCI